MAVFDEFFNVGGALRAPALVAPIARIALGHIARISQNGHGVVELRVVELALVVHDQMQAISTAWENVTENIIYISYIYDLCWYICCNSNELSFV